MMSWVASVGLVLDPVERHDPGVVDQHVDRAELRLDLVEEALERRAVRHVDDPAEHRRALALHGDLVQVADGHGRADAGEQLRRRGADATPAAGDDDDLAGQVPLHGATAIQSANPVGSWRPRLACSNSPQPTCPLQVARADVVDDAPRDAARRSRASVRSYVDALDPALALPVAVGPLGVAAVAAADVQRARTTAVSTSISSGSPSGVVRWMRRAGRACGCRTRSRSRRAASRAARPGRRGRPASASLRVRKPSGDSCTITITAKSSKRSGT